MKATQGVKYSYEMFIRDVNVILEEQIGLTVNDIDGFEFRDCFDMLETVESTAQQAIEWVQEDPRELPL